MLQRIFNTHFEWVALTLGLLLMAALDPYNTGGESWCLFELLHIPYCPGEGLGHSIAFTVRGDFTEALEANFMGPAAIVILMARIGYLQSKIFFNNQKKRLKYHG